MKKQQSAGFVNKILKKVRKKVRDHCHYSGRFKCNSLLRKPKFVPVTFHKLSGYDVHLFVKNLKGNSDCILNNEEKYISFSRSIYDDEKKFKYKIRFIDSYKFMDSNLDKLANNQNENQFKHIRQTFNDEQCRLSTRKGVYPYDYIDCLDKLDEKQLPPKAFYSRLYDSDITDEDYEHAQNVW